MIVFSFAKYRNWLIYMKFSLYDAFANSGLSSNKPWKSNGDQTDLNGWVVGVLVTDEEGSLDGAAVRVDEILPEYLLVDPVNNKFVFILRGHGRRHGSPDLVNVRRRHSSDFIKSNE